MPPASTTTHVAASVGTAIDAMAKSLAAATTPGSEACRQRAREKAQRSETSGENQPDDDLEDVDLPLAIPAPDIRDPGGDRVRIKDSSKMLTQLEPTKPPQRPKQMQRMQRRHG